MNDRCRKLCAEIADEQDPKKLRKLLNELSEELNLDHKKSAKVLTFESKERAC